MNWLPVGAIVVLWAGFHAYHWLKKADLNGLLKPPPPGDGATPERPPAAGPDPARLDDPCLPRQGAAPGPSIRAAASTRRLIRRIDVYKVNDEYCGCAVLWDYETRGFKELPCLAHTFDVDAWNQRLDQS